MSCNDAILFESVVCFFYNWQTLLTGLLAVGAAWLTIRQVRQQIILQKKQLDIDESRHQESRAIKALGAKAQLPDALSSLGQYAAECMNFVRNLEGAASPPQLPDEAISTLKSVIEYVDQESVRELFDLIGFYQVHNSRLRSFAGDPNHRPQERQDRTLDSIRLRAMTDRLYDYAREFPNRGNHVCLDRDAMIAALRSCADPVYFFAHRGQFAQIEAAIERAYPADPPQAESVQAE